MTLKNPSVEVDRPVDWALFVGGGLAVGAAIGLALSAGIEDPWLRLGSSVFGALLGAAISWFAVRWTWRRAEEEPIDAPR
jgi:hypothetical protein